MTTKADGPPPGANPLWVVDDRPSRRFPIYTRGNTGEVYPNVITPLCGSIVKDPIALGQQQVFLEMGAVVPADIVENDCAVLTGCFGGYLYANLSVGRLLGARAPGMKPEDADAQMFGTTDAPPYRRQPGDRNIRATARLAALMTRVVRGPDFGWLQAERDDAVAWTVSRPAPAPATEEELLATVDQGAARLTPLMRSLLLASAYGGVAASLVDRLGAKAEPVDKAKTALGIGGVESASPAAALWALAQVVTSTPAVAEAFEGGTGVAARLARAGPAAEPFLLAFAAFVDRYGSRGPDEWELASHTWGTDPEIALAAVERIRHADAPDPTAVQARLADERLSAVDTAARSVPAPVRPLFRRATRIMAQGAAGREFAKGTIVLTLYAVRLALFELVERAQRRGGPTDRRDCWLVTRDELERFVAAPTEFAETIAERKERRDFLQDRVPPFVFEGEIPDPATWVRRDAPTSAPAATAGACLGGIGVSPGIARGRVRVIRDPADPRALEPGDVLVAPITDPAWTPLFIVASAVVCDVGANLSHAAIVARELGIPAVVSVDDATRRLPDGATVEVDGTRGTVTMLS